MLVRLGDAARHSLDVDLYRPTSGLAEAESALREAVELDLGDHFRFVVTPGRMIVEGRPIMRVPVAAYLGATTYARFHVDLSTGLAMTGAPDLVDDQPLARILGLPSASYRLYPVADHVADKLCALLEVYDRAGSQPQASTRYRDVVDLVVIARTLSVDAARLRTAFASESARRAIALPAAFTVPDAPGWPAGYARVARAALFIVERDLRSAIATVSRFIDPVLDGTAGGAWAPDEQAWSPS